MISYHPPCPHLHDARDLVPLLVVLHLLQQPTGGRQLHALRREPHGRVGVGLVEHLRGGETERVEQGRQWLCQVDDTGGRVRQTNKTKKYSYEYRWVAGAVNSSHSAAVRCIAVNCPVQFNLA